MSNNPNDMWTLNYFHEYQSIYFKNYKLTEIWPTLKSILKSILYFKYFELSILYFVF